LSLYKFYNNYKYTCPKPSCKANVLPCLYKCHFFKAAYTFNTTSPRCNFVLQEPYNDRAGILDVVISNIPKARRLVFKHIDKPISK
jgi:hypothetical protein